MTTEVEESPLERAVNMLFAIVDDLETAAEDLFEGGDIEFSNGLHGLSNALKMKIIKRYPDLAGMPSLEEE